MDFGRSRREVNAIGPARAKVITGRRDARIERTQDCA